MDNNISMGAFVKMLLFYFNENDITIDSLFSLGILEDCDRNLEQFVNKKTLARILHQCLLNYLKENDLSDWSAALSLKDLNDCHTCTRHIAQIYSKGIMPSFSERIFGNESLVSCDDCSSYIEKTFHPEFRKMPAAIKSNISSLTYEEINSLNLINNALFIDVRSYDDFNEAVIFQKSLWKNIPLREIQLNPYIIGQDYYKPIILQCTHGYLASTAANLLNKYGYKNLYVINKEGC